MGRAFEAVNPNVPCSRVWFFSCAMVTRGYKCKLTLVALKELSVSHVRESGLKSTFVFQVASKAGVLSEFVFRTRRDEVRYVFPGRVWSDHYKLQLYDNANNARSKTEASRFKAKIKRRIET